MKVLLVTNDFPPTVGGIQSYLRDFVDEVVAREGAGAIVVFASAQDAEAARAWDAAVPYEVVRWPESVMLPTPGVRREMTRLIRCHGVDTVWFGAAAPLGLLGAAARAAGARRVVATTHGHEGGWAMLPGARAALRRIGREADMVTYISEYTLGRLRPAFGTRPRFTWLPSGVDTSFFRPADVDRRAATRADLGVGQAPLIVCASRLVARKGQDQLLRALPQVRSIIDDTQLVIVGDGSYRSRLEALTAGLAPGDRDAVTFTGSVPRERLRDIVAAADVFAMPARTRMGGLDVEGLGIVYLEAQACGVPVVAGRSGGASETVVDASGIVVDGRNVGQVASALTGILAEPDRAGRMGEMGRAFVEERFSWAELGDRLHRVLASES